MVAVNRGDGFAKKDAGNTGQFHRGKNSSRDERKEKTGDASDQQHVGHGAQEVVK